MKKFAVILSGCGVYDGAEIHESVLTLLAIDRLGGTWQCFAPDIPQAHVINHLRGEVVQQSRNVLEESARIARGAILPMDQYKASGCDALVLPGGFGCAKNLCDWAFSGDACEVNPQVERAISETYRAGKPIGAMCIAPVILARLFEGKKLTTGQDPVSQKFIESRHHTYVPTSHGEVVVNEDNLIFTTPCYMLDASITEIAQGTENLIRAMMEAMH